MVYGLILVVMPTLTLQGFSLMIYDILGHIHTFNYEPTARISLLHAVLGAVMFGWGVLLMYLALGPIRRGDKDAYSIRCHARIS